MVGSLWTAAERPDAGSIVSRSVQANAKDFKAAPGYDYSERDRVAGGTRTYRVLMIEGSPYQELTMVNQQPLAPDLQAEEQRKLDQTIAQRRTESPAAKAQRVAKYNKQRTRNQLLLNQLALAFKFKLIGEQQLGSRTVYAIQAIPRPGYVPPNREAQVLTGMHGKLWIDTATYQWVKVEAEVTHPVWIGGFLAKVMPGTRFELEYSPVSGNIWLPSHYSMKSRARVLFLFSSGQQDDETYFDYAKSPRAAPNVESGEIR